MKKNLMALALTAAMGICLAGGVANWNSASADESANVINAVTGANGFVTEDEWAAQEAYAITGANVGSVKLATVGTNLFFRMVVEDATKFTNKDRIAYNISTNGVTQNIQGNFDPWLTGDWGFGSNVQTELAYHENLGAYVATIGFDLGDNYIPGNEVSVSFTFNDSTSEDIGWGAGAASTYSGTLYLGEKASEPDTPEVSYSYEIPMVATELQESDWDACEAYVMAPVGETTGASGTLKFIVANGILYMQMEVEDATKCGNDRPDYNITIGDKTASARGNYTGWLADRVQDFGATVMNETNYADGKYTMTLGFNIGDLAVDGTEVKVSVSHADAQTEDQQWADGLDAYPHAIEFTKTLTIAGQAVEPEQPEQPEVNYSYVVPMLSTGLVASDWDACEAYVMNPIGETTGATGTVKFIVANGILYFQMVVEDATQLENDRPDYKMTIGGKTASARGKYDGGDGSGLPWLADRVQDFGQTVLSEITYANGKYTMTLGFDIGDLAVEGAHLAVEMSHGDAQVAENGWADSVEAYPHGLKFANTLYIGAYSETDPVAPEVTPEEPTPDTPTPDTPADPEPTPGPENVDLGIVVTDLVSMPTESDWAKATAYDLIPNTGNITGAIGTIKIYTAAQNIFYRVEINDASTHIQNDRIYIYLGTEECNFESRGNYDNWLTHFNNDLGSPSLFECKTSASEVRGYGEGVYTFTQGFYLPDLYAEGAQIRLCVKHCDSRSAAEGWVDSDYTHTIYFDQIITFGAPADTTIRPQAPTDGFTGSAANISYNKADICWNEFAGAETYSIYVYEVNPDGSEEPYTNISNEGPIYAGLDSYEELISGLSEKTNYAVQVVAYDANEEVIGYSELIAFATISRQEAMNPETPDDPGTSDEPEVPGTSDEPEAPGTSEDPMEQPSTSDEGKKKGGCGSSLGLGMAGVLTAVGAALVIKKRKED